ncbi:hypothetical protein COOONC_25695, partial [Cooperia oncophora]
LQIDLDDEESDPNLTASYVESVVARVKGDPLYCNTTACLDNTGLKMGTFARQMHDAFYMYASALSRADSLKPDGRKDALTMTRAMQGSFQGTRLNCEIIIFGDQLVRYRAHRTGYLGLAYR